MLRIYHKENLPPRGGVIIASNHLSFLDPLILGVASPRILYFMAKSELFKPKCFSWLIRNLGAFEVQKGKADRKAIKRAVELLRQGEAIAIFPEGTRSKDGSLQPGETGCVWLAKIAPALIVPTRIYGTNLALPIDGKIVRPKPVKVIFGAPLEVRKYVDASLENLTKILMERIGEL